MIPLLLALGVLLLALLLWPTLAPARTTPADTRRLELTEEREQLLGSLRELESQNAESSLMTREKVRLAQVLQELDHLPPTPTAGTQKAAFPVALGALLGVLAVLGLGLATVFPAWRSSGLSASERTTLQNATQLPKLARTAQQTGSVADLNAWGDAAWDAQKYQDAAKAYTQVLTANRADAKALRRVGFFLLKDEKMAQTGLGFIQRSVLTDPRAPEGQLLYGYALGLFGEYAEGLKVLKNYQALAPASHEADDLLVDYQSRVGVAVDGGLVYAQNCAACHGANLEGGRGPKLLGSAALHNEAALRSIILNGATGMPAFKQLEGKQLDALVKYLAGK